MTLSQSLGPFSDEERRLCVTLEVSADSRCDGSPSETLTVRLNSSDPNVTLTPANSSVVILDSPQCSECIVVCGYTVLKQTRGEGHRFGGKILYSPPEKNGWINGYHLSTPFLVRFRLSGVSRISERGVFGTYNLCACADCG